MELSLSPSFHLLPSTTTLSLFTHHPLCHTYTSAAYTVSGLGSWSICWWSQWDGNYFNSHILSALTLPQPQHHIMCCFCCPCTTNNDPGPCLACLSPHSYGGSIHVRSISQSMWFRAEILREGQQCDSWVKRKPMDLRVLRLLNIWSSAREIFHHHLPIFPWLFSLLFVCSLKMCSILLDALGFTEFFFLISSSLCSNLWHVMSVPLGGSGLWDLLAQHWMEPEAGSDSVLWEGLWQHIGLEKGRAVTLRVGSGEATVLGCISLAQKGMHDSKSWGIMSSDRGDGKWKFQAGTAVQKEKTGSIHT